MMKRKNTYTTHREEQQQRKEHTKHVLNILQNGAKCPLNDSTNSDLDQNEVKEVTNTGKNKVISLYIQNSQIDITQADTETIYKSTNCPSLPRGVRRTRSFTSLTSVPEERELAYVIHSPKHNKENQAPRKAGFTFDIRNLRQSFRRKTKTSSSIVSLVPQSALPNLSKEQLVKSNDPSYYYDRPLKDCAKCKGLLKDPRFCKCPGAAIIEKGGSHSSAQYYHATEMHREVPLKSNHLPDSGYEGSAFNGYQGSMISDGASIISGESFASTLPGSTNFGTLPLRKNEHTNQMRLGSYNISRNQIENLSIHRPFVGADAFHKWTNKPPKESSITLVKTISLPCLTNIWISDIAVTRKGDIIVTDLKEVHVVDNTGKSKRIIGNKGNKKVIAPFSVTLDTHGNVLISDHSAHKLEVFGIKGSHLRTITDESLSNITSICCNNQNDIIITSTDKEHISIYSQNDKRIRFLESQQSQNLFQHPVSVGVNPLTCDIIVGDAHKECIVAITNAGLLLWTFTPPGDKTRPFYPASLCADCEGYIFVADLYNEKVHMIDCSGKFLKTVLSNGAGLTGAPVVITVDGKGNLIVSDAQRMLKVFKYGENGFAMHRRFSYCPDIV